MGDESLKTIIFKFFLDVREKNMNSKNTQNSLEIKRLVSGKFAEKRQLIVAPNF